MARGQAKVEQFFYPNRRKHQKEVQSSKVLETKLETAGIKYMMHDAFLFPLIDSLTQDHKILLLTCSLGKVVSTHSPSFSY